MNSQSNILFVSFTIMCLCKITLYTILLLNVGNLVGVLLVGVWLN
jgi:hypothetical protein